MLAEGSLEEEDGTPVDFPLRKLLNLISDFYHANTLSDAAS